MRKNLAILAAFWTSVLVAAEKPNYPATAKHPVSQVYGGTTFRDDYQWLEKEDDAAVQEWVVAQNVFLRSSLAGVPARAEIAKRLDKLYKSPRLAYYAVTQRAGKIFALKFDPPKEQALLVAFESQSDPKSERVVLDPNAIDAKGAISIDFYVPSFDAGRVAVSLSKHGSEDGELHLVDVATGKELGDVIPRVNYPTAGGSVAWNADGSAFWYTRYPQGNERPAEDINFYQQIWFHAVGTPASSDKYALGREFPRIAEIQMSNSDDGKNILATVRNGDGGEMAHWLRRADGSWTQMTKFEDQIHKAEFGGDGAIYMLSHAGAPNGKILRVRVDDPKIENAAIVVDTTKAGAPPLPDGLRAASSPKKPDRGMSVDTFQAGRNVLHVAMMAGGPSELLTYDRKGKLLGRVPIPPISAIYEMVGLGGDDLLVNNATYTSVPRWFRYDAATKKISPAALRSAAPTDLSDAVVVREFATSKDGTEVPLNILYRRGTKLDGTNPTILRGYGGYSISQRPGMQMTNRVWLDAGGVVAYANLRGGGEFGEAWHEAGKMLAKQNVFDDLIACAQHLIARKYTSPAKLAIEGGSNGGLLMGAAMTQRPDLFRAVVTHVGIYDVPRWLSTPNGVFNTTEFGSPDNPQQLRAIMAYSPYHRVVDGTAYPATLVLTGENDGRVDPMNSRKFVARLQAANGSQHPILLRTATAAGHGMGTSLTEALNSRTDVFAFLWKELDIAPLPPK